MNSIPAGFPSPLHTLRWAIDTFVPGLVMTSALGLNGVALAHMLHTLSREVPIVFVDTGYHFAETLATKRRIEAAYGLRVLTYHPAERVQVPARQIGPDLPDRWPNLCCAVRKVEPMQRALAELQPKAILNARARFQADTRRDLPLVEWDQAPVRINPLAGWSLRQVRAYVAAHDVPYNPLHDRGYPSVGCRPCTRPVAAGENQRAGRWPGMDKTECGLWTQPLVSQLAPAG